MYLSTKQHDQLQILVTSFEIPFRSYVALEVIKRYPTPSAFSADLINRRLPSTANTDYQFIRSELGKIKADPASFYELLVQSKSAKETGHVPNEINVPLQLLLRLV